MKAEVVRVLLHLGIRKPIKELARTMTTSEEAWRVASKARDTFARSAAALREFDRNASQRLELAVSLLHWDGIDSRVPNAADLRGEIARMAPALRVLETAHSALYDMRTCNAVLSALIGCIQNDIKSENVFNDLNSRASGVSRDLRSLLDRLAQADYPFDHASGNVSLLHYALSDGIPAPDDLGAAVGAAAELTDALFPLYGRILARVAAIVEEVETACKLPLLPEAKKVQDTPDIQNSSEGKGR